MTLTELNALGFYLSGLSQTKDGRRFGVTVRSMSENHWYGFCEGATSIETAIEVAYAHCQELMSDGTSSRYGRYAPKYETDGETLLKSLGLSKRGAKTSAQEFLKLRGGQDGSQN